MKVASKTNRKRLKIAFDVDDTLYKIRVDKYDQVPDYELIQVLKWFCQNGDEVFIWSAGGVEYAKAFAKKFGFDDMVSIVEKGSFKPDISFDEYLTGLGKTDVIINRNTSEADILKIAKPNIKKIVNEKTLI
jgi:trehalose-6-phosphatase